MSIVPDADIRVLIRDKYGGLDTARSGELARDLERLAAGEPLAYVIGWVPFLGLHLRLDGRPLIPRPETEWWTNELLQVLAKRFGDKAFEFLDLCAGSGTIGLAVLARFPHARVSFGEISSAHTDLIALNIEQNHLDRTRATIRRSDLFTSFFERTFDIIATNPPYIPAGRALEQSVLAYEPGLALFAGTGGLDVIRRISREAAKHMNPDGELWMECDTSNVQEAQDLLLEGGARRTQMRTDQYGRPRLAVGYYS